MKVVKYRPSLALAVFSKVKADICMELPRTNVRQISSKRGMEMMCCVK